MRKIVQIEEYEYNKLVETAKLKEKQIEKEALRLWKEKGVAEIKITVDKHTDYDDVFSIKCDTSVFYKSDKFYIPEQIRNRFRKIIKDEVMYSVEEKFGEPVKLVNIFNKKVDRLNHARYALYAIAASGWAVAAVLMFC